ncbi:flagellar hook-length control protein FliK [uncultured Sulfitobacter sp.]|uniref:flagellar hook-length control protein FliK n=1 Tax=uncultured Sulfitobacter sp. TaxID=191468 RepID=UPI0030F92A02
MQLSDTLGPVIGNGAKANHRSTELGSDSQNQSQATGTNNTTFSAIFSGLSQTGEPRESDDISGRHPSAADNEADETHPQAVAESDIDADPDQLEKPARGALENEEITMAEEAPIEVAPQRLKKEQVGGKGIAGDRSFQSLAEVSLWPKTGQTQRNVAAGASSSHRLSGTTAAQMRPVVSATSTTETRPLPAPEMTAVRTGSPIAALRPQGSQEPSQADGPQTAPALTSKRPESVPAIKPAGSSEVLHPSVAAHTHSSGSPHRPLGGQPAVPTGGHPLNLANAGSAKEVELFSSDALRQESKTSGAAEGQKLGASLDPSGARKPSSTDSVPPPRATLTPPKEPPSTANPSQNRNQTAVQPELSQSSQTGLAATPAGAVYGSPAAPLGTLVPNQSAEMPKPRTEREARDNTQATNGAGAENITTDKPRNTLAALTRAANTQKLAAQPPQPSGAADDFRLALGVSGEEPEGELIQTQLTEQSRSVSQVPTQFSAKAGIPQHIPRQLAEIIHTSGGKSVDVALSPEELGRVRLSISQAEGGLVVSVQAERPETLDMLRRNIDQLDQELRLLGYTDPGFSFSHEGGDTGQQPDTLSRENAIAEDQPAVPVAGAVPESQPTSLGNAGLDIRL